MIISSQELSQYFGKDKTPREMKDQILKLLDEWKASRRRSPNRKRRPSRKSNEPRAMLARGYYLSQ